MNTIDRLYPAIAKGIEAKNAANKAKAARMTFGGVASLFEAKLTAIIQANDKPVTMNGHIGTFQLFTYLHSASAYKKAAAQAILDARQAIRFNKIYRGWDLNAEIRSDLRMNHIADMRQRAFAAGV